MCPHADNTNHKKEEDDNVELLKQSVDLGGSDIHERKITLLRATLKKLDVFSLKCVLHIFATFVIDCPFKLLKF